MKYHSLDLAFEWEHRAYERLADVAEKIDNGLDLKREFGLI